MIFQPAAGAGVARAGHLAGQDLQVGHRVDPGAVGQHQVPVVLVGVRAGGLGPDRDVADPHRVRAVALQGALVGDPAAAVALGVVDEQPVLQVLPGVGEVQAAQLGVAAGPGVADRRGQPDHAAAERDRGVRDPRVPADLGVVMRQVHRVAGPVLQADHGQLRRRRRRSARRCRRRWRCRCSPAPRWRWPGGRPRSPGGRTPHRRCRRHGPRPCSAGRRSRRGARSARWRD